MSYWVSKYVAIELMKNGSSSYRWSHKLNLNAGCSNVKNFKELVRYDMIGIRWFKGDTYWSYGKRCISYAAHSRRAFFYHFKSNARPGQISTFYFLIFWNGVILWRNFVQNLIMATKIWKKHPLWSFRELFQDGYRYSAKS